jgi:hypothetical protein
VVAPSLIPKKPGDRVKNNRRDALQRTFRRSSCSSGRIFPGGSRHQTSGSTRRGSGVSARPLRLGEDGRSKPQSTGIGLLHLG